MAEDSCWNQTGADSHVLEALLLFALPLLFTLQKLVELPEFGVSSHQLVRLFYTAIDPMAVNGGNDDGLPPLPVRPSRWNHSRQASRRAAY